LPEQTSHFFTHNSKPKTHEEITPAEFHRCSFLS